MKRGAAAPYAVWDAGACSADIVIDGLKVDKRNGSTGWTGVRASLGKSAGKWGFEITYTGTQIGGPSRDLYEVAGLASALWPVGLYYPGGDTHGIGMNATSPFWHIYNNGFVLPTSNGAGDWNFGDVATFLWDADTGDLTVKRNGALSSTKSLPAFAGVEMFPAVGLYTASSGCIANFGPLQYPEAGYNDGWYAE